MKLGVLFRNYRAVQGLTQKSVAEEIGVPPRVVARIEDGTFGLQQVDGQQLSKICDWLFKREEKLNGTQTDLLNVPPAA